MPDELVSILVAAHNALPFIKLQHAQMEKFRDRTSFKYWVWDNASKDGTVEWLRRNGIAHHSCPNPTTTHSQSLRGLIEKTTTPYVCYMDVDAFPVKAGWLDEAVAALDHKTLIAGLSAYTGWRLFVHPSFLVVRRDSCQKLKLEPTEVREGALYYDVGSKMSEQVETAGFGIRFLGSANFPVEHLPRWYQKVCHLHGATAILNKQGHPEDQIKRIVAEHKKKLQMFGVWDQFQQFVRESLPSNVNGGRYLDPIVPAK